MTKELSKQQIADILKQCRLAAGFTQAQAAAQIGRKQQTLASWEIAQAQPDAGTLFELCRLYGVSMDETFGLDETDHLRNELRFSPERKALLKASYKLKPEAIKSITRMIESLPEID